MQWIINGVSDGLLIGLLSVAFMLVYSTTGIFYVALAGVFTLAPFVSAAVERSGASWPFALAAGALSSAGLSALIEAVNHWRLERRKTSPAAHLVTSLGINIVIVQVLSLVWGNELQVLGSTSATSIVHFAGISLGRGQCIALVAVPLVILVLHFWTHYSRSSLPLRALTSNPQELALTGVNVRAVRMIVFSLSGLLAAIASFVRAQDAGFDAVSGLSAVVLAFAALIIGGRNALWGGILGGTFLGVLRSGIANFGSTRWQEPVTFVLLGLFLLFWPQGFLGWRSRIEAER